MPDTPQRLLNIDELAELLGVKRGWVRDKVTARQLPHHRIGRHVRFTAEDVEAIVAAAAEPVVKPQGVVLVYGRSRRRA